MKVYSLTLNGKEEVSVEMDVTIPGITPRLNRQWLRGIVHEQLRKKTAAPVAKSRRRSTPVAA
jgi:hypothetical protein